MKKLFPSEKNLYILIHLENIKSTIHFFQNQAPEFEVFALYQISIGDTVTLLYLVTCDPTRKISIKFIHRKNNIKDEWKPESHFKIGFTKT